MTRNIFHFSASSAVLCLALSLSAATPNAIDRGPLGARETATSFSITIALRLPKLADAEKLNEAIYAVGDPQYHQFLTSDEFVKRFAPTEGDVAKIVSALGKYGLSAEKTTATTLRVTGLPANFERAFQVSLHTYEVLAHDKTAGYSYRAPTSHIVIPAEISSAVAAVAGLNNAPAMQPQFKTIPPVLKSPLATPPPIAANSGTINPFQFLTVADFVKVYDVAPLYKKGLTGAGRTMGVLTFASFTPSDAFAYWQALGLNVNPNRITVVNVDGGAGPPNDAAGSIETTLDVEQSGGIAPGANILVYEGPNFFATVVDVFAKAIDDNKADTLAMSWGLWEWLFNLENDPVPDPTSGKTVAATQAIHELLLRASIQGQSAMAAAGDGGAYEANANFGCFGPYSPSVPGSCSLTLSTLYPASDPYITAAGGTTLPGLQQYCQNAACTPPFFDVTIAHESVWGWDYLDGFCKQVVGLNPIACGIFPGGTGGGVSVAFPVPLYQLLTLATQLSQPGQNFSLQGFGLLDAEPAFYPGRNLPDVSFNADPNTGYQVFYTSSNTGFGVVSGFGGTSFVDQQLSGVTALLGQQLNKRVGFLNPSLYSRQLFGLGYFGPNAPFRAITSGDNWFYHGSFGYNPGAGLGTLDVANFAQAMHGLFF